MAWTRHGHQIPGTPIENDRPKEVARCGGVIHCPECATEVAPPPLPKRVKTIAVDFDGVIHAYSGGWKNGTIYDEPVRGAFEALRNLMNKYAVFVFTSRNPAQVANWLIKSGFPTRLFPNREETPEFWNKQGTLLVTNVKLPAFAYIDDRAICFHNWEQTLEIVDYWDQMERRKNERTRNTRPV
jgi:hypothetical protein